MKISSAPARHDDGNLTRMLSSARRFRRSIRGCHLLASQREANRNHIPL